MSKEYPEFKNLYERFSYFFRMSLLQHRKVVDKNISKTGVYRGQHHILMYLFHNPRRSQKEIANAIDISTATVAVSIKKLEKNGYIIRIMNEEDNRFNTVDLSEQGLEVVRKSIEIFELIDSTMLEEFSVEEIETFIGYLQRLHTKLTDLSEIELILEGDESIDSKNQ